MVEDEFIKIAAEYLKDGAVKGIVRDCDHKLYGYFEVYLFNSVLHRLIQMPYAERSLDTAYRELDEMIDLFF